MNYEIINDPLQGESYFDINGPFKNKFRNGDSSWSQASDEELNNRVDELNNTVDKDKMKVLERMMKAKSYEKN